MQLRVIASYALSIALMLGATVCIVGYAANGIVYGDLVGLRGREHDLHLAGVRALYFLFVVIGLQIAAGVSIVSLLPRRLARARGAVARFAIGLSISIAGTAFLFFVFIGLNRVLRLFEVGST